MEGLLPEGHCRAPFVRVGDVPPPPPGRRPRRPVTRASNKTRTDSGTVSGARLLVATRVHGRAPEAPAVGRDHARAAQPRQAAATTQLFSLCRPGPSWAMQNPGDRPLPTAKRQGEDRQTSGVVCRGVGRQRPMPTHSYSTSMLRHLPESSFRRRGRGGGGRRYPRLPRLRSAPHLVRNSRQRRARPCWLHRLVRSASGFLVHRGLRGPQSDWLSELSLAGATGIALGLAAWAAFSIVDARGLLWLWPFLTTPMLLRKRVRSRLRELPDEHWRLGPSMVVAAAAVAAIWHMDLTFVRVYQLPPSGVPVLLRPAMAHGPRTGGDARFPDWAHRSW